jgi:alanine dehydrogenase
MAELGVRGAVDEDAGLRSGVLLWEGHVTNAVLARESGLPFKAPG